MATNAPRHQREDERFAKANLWVIIGISAFLILCMAVIVVMYNAGRL